MTKRDAICEAALELFAEKGIEATTVREIAERAEAAEGTLYRHFSGKDELASWLYDRCSADLQTRLRKATQQASSPPERLDGLVRGVYTFFGERPTSCTYLLAAGVKRKNGGSAPASSEGGPLPLFVDVLEEGMERGRFREDSAPLLAGWILSMVQHTVSALKSGRLDMEKGEAVARTLDAVRRLTAATGS